MQTKNTNITTWLNTYFPNHQHQNQLQTYLKYLQHHQHTITKITTQHPPWTERPPLHLPYIYQHTLHIQDKKPTHLFQKNNYSQTLPTLLSILFFILIPKFSKTFRTHHKQWEQQHGKRPYLTTLNPNTLWTNNINFLHHLGTHWQHPHHQPIGPTWILANNTTHVTEGIYDHNGTIGTTMKHHLHHELTHGIQTNWTNSNTITQYGIQIAKSIKHCYKKQHILIDLNLNNFIYDKNHTARLIDGEFFTHFHTPIPAHYKSMELALFMGILYLETTQHYCKTIQSPQTKNINNYQKGILLLLSSLLKEINYEPDELKNALTMYQDTASKLGHLFFHLMFCLQNNQKTIQLYQKNLQKNLITTIENLI